MGIGTTKHRSVFSNQPEQSFAEARETKMKNNKMKMKFVLFLGFSLIVLLAFVSCQQKIGQTIATLPPTAMANATLSQSPLDLLTASPMSTTIVEVKETATPSSNLITPAASPTIMPMTITPSSTPVSPTIVPVTLTPLPTLEGAALESSVAELLANPMDCDVPCWWGFIPGITDISEVRHAISPYGFDIYEYYDEERNLYTRLGIGYVAKRNDFETRIVFRFSDSILTGVTAYSPSTLEILTKYGKPDEIWLETMGFEREGDLPVRLNLVYLQKGMATGYVVDGDIQDDMVRGCFADKETGRLSLVTPNNATSYKDFSTIFEEDRRYLPLGQATGLTMDEFMERFSDPTQPQCIETPTELWK